MKNVRHFFHNLKHLFDRPRVIWEGDMPPQFAITTHAELRLIQRVKVSRRKMAELVEKAWYCKSIPTPRLEKFQNKADYNYTNERIAKECMGKIYIFSYGTNPRAPFPPQLVLITVI